MKPATIILLYCLVTAGAWLTGVYVGAMWERQTMRLVDAGLMCVCKR